MYSRTKRRIKLPIHLVGDAYVYIYMLWINYSEEPIKQYKNPIPQVETQMIHFHEQPKNGF